MVFDSAYALVIGVGSYLNEPKLNVPLTAEDAQEVAAVLRDPRYCGYPEQQVTLLHDARATREAISIAQFIWYLCWEILLLGLLLFLLFRTYFK